ncbi:protein rep, partial [Candidatus Pacearchaeota archaeon]|nr:protein rep [Candidatus Pacearchaeota archaeon]
ELAATREAYAAMEDKSSERRMNAFDTCRHRAWFVRHEETGDLRVAAKSCKLRWCPLCSKKKQWFLVEQFRPWAESVDKLKFLTLTLKHSNASLHDQVCNLYKFFQTFRKLKYLRDNMQGGVWFFQITKSKKTGQWHPHLHCLIDAKFMSQDKLSALWCRTTLGSTIVDIRSCKDSKKIAEYVGRYSARPSSLAGMSLDERLEVMTALHGRRLVGTWGTAREMTLAMKKPDDADMWKHVGNWSTIWGTLAYDDNAKKIFNAWRMDEPLEPGVNMRHIENSMYGLEPFSQREPPEKRQLYLDFMK